MAFHRTNLPTHALFSFVPFIFLLLATNLNTLQTFNIVLPITLQGDAQFKGNGVIALTKKPSSQNSSSVGRALYDFLLPVRESFNFSFSFSIETYDKATKGPLSGGLIVFIAPPHTKIPTHSNASFLGVVDNETSINPFVGVEFDLYSNSWDPHTRHIGIDVNSIISIKHEEYIFVSGSKTKVTLYYDSPKSKLSAVIEYGDGPVSIVTVIEQDIDLKSFLPDEVQIGLSAATSTGDSYYIHGIPFPIIPPRQGSDWSQTYE